HRGNRFLTAGPDPGPANSDDDPEWGSLMNAEIIDGKAFAERLREKVARYAAEFEKKANRKAGLAVVLVGEDPASQVYVRSKGKATVAAGMNSFEFRMDADTPEEELLAKV